MPNEAVDLAPVEAGRRRALRLPSSWVRWLALWFRRSREADAEVTLERSLRIARETLRRTEFCFFITRGAAGEANARVLQPSAPRNDFTIWFGTSPGSRKVAELKRDDRVTLTYESPGKGFVSLTGRASVHSELALRRRWWRDTWYAFFPDGPETDDFAVVKFEPSRIEVLHFPARLTPAPFGLKPAILVRDGQGWLLG